MSEQPPVTTVGALMDALGAGQTTVSIPVAPGSGSVASRAATRATTGSKMPQGLSDIDALWRRCHRYYGSRLTDAVLLKAIDAVAEHTGQIVHQVRRMTLAEFTAALDAAMGTPRYGPHATEHRLHWGDAEYPLTLRTWQFLTCVWGRHDVSFADIGEAVWGDDSASSNRVRQLIYRVNSQLAGNVDLMFTSEGESVSPIQPWPT